MADVLKLQGVVRNITQGEQRKDGETPPTFLRIGGVSVMAARTLTSLPEVNDEIVAQVSSILKSRDVKNSATGEVRTQYYAVHILEKWRPVEL